MVRESYASTSSADEVWVCDLVRTSTAVRRVYKVKAQKSTLFEESTERSPAA
jgi:hypothetical protein